MTAHSMHKVHYPHHFKIIIACFLFLGKMSLVFYYFRLKNPSENNEKCP